MKTVSCPGIAAEGTAREPKGPPSAAQAALPCRPPGDLSAPALRAEGGVRRGRGAQGAQKGTYSKQWIAKFGIAAGPHPAFVGSNPTPNRALFLKSKRRTQRKSRHHRSPLGRGHAPWKDTDSGTYQDTYCLCSRAEGDFCEKAGEKMRLAGAGGRRNDWAKRTGSEPLAAASRPPPTFHYQSIKEDFPCWNT